MINPTLDYPHTRAGAVCPVCVLEKPIGCLVCWRCFRDHDMRRGTSIKITQTLRAFEWTIANHRAREVRT